MPCHVYLKLEIAQNTSLSDGAPKNLDRKHQGRIWNIGKGGGVNCVFQAVATENPGAKPGLKNLGF